MYKELEKYKIKERVDGVGVLPDGQEIKIKVDEYEAGLGDLLSDFIDHKNKSFLKKKYYDDHLTKIYLDMLNKVKIIHQL